MENCSFKAEYFCFDFKFESMTSRSSQLRMEKDQVQGVGSMDIFRVVARPRQTKQLKGSNYYNSKLFHGSHQSWKVLEFC